jgi:hypothetical protein
MSRIISGLVFLAVLLTAASPTWADNIFSTDRFGYTGTVTRYDTLSDAQNNVNALDSFSIEDVANDPSREHRDVSIYVTDGTGSDAVEVLGSWWYTTSVNGAGWGNINGNTGIGFMQLYDDDSSTDTSLDMGFEAFDGTYWTEYYMRVEGENATAAEDAARLSAYNNVNDAGTYLDYVLDIRATGLEGTDSGGVIVANNHPTGVSGTFSALFSFGGDPDGYPDDVGPEPGWDGDYYRVELAFDIENWAFSQNGSLLGPYVGDNGEIYASYFEGTERVPVPEPGTALLLALGVVSLGLVRRKGWRQAFISS